MIASHFFPRNYCTRRATVVRDRRSSLGIHSFVLSKDKDKQGKSTDQSQALSLNQLQVKQRSLNLRINPNQEDGKVSQKGQLRDEGQGRKFNPRKKSLYVKGFCKKPSFQLKINPYNELGIREAVSQNCRRLKKDPNLQKMRMGTSIPLEPNRKQIKLTKRKSKQTCVFRGWEISYDDFTDF